jgi:hypothetical protein
MFAWPLKAGCCAMFGWTPEQVQGVTPEAREWRETVLPEFGFSPREAMQKLGTEWGRDVMHKDLWVLIANQNLRKLESAEKPPVGVVVSDVRFPNEVNWIRDNGGEVWHIERPGLAAADAHASEVGVERQAHDIVLYNTGTAEGIQQAAQIIVRGPV